MMILAFLYFCLMSVFCIYFCPAKHCCVFEKYEVE